jgi:hypothetical protein
MSYLAATIIVCAASIAGGFASFAVRSRVSVELRRRHQDVGFQVFQQVGVMFAVLLAFVFSEVWGEYNTAAQAINGECGALHGAAILANALPGATGRPINRAILAYAGTVVNTEWPTMSHRSENPQAVQQFRVVLDTAARLPVTERADVSTRSQIVSLLTVAHANRETRTFQIDRSIPMAMWVVLILLGFMLEAFVLFAGTETVPHIVFASAFAGCTVLILVLVRMLDFPFEGALALPVADFVNLLREVSDMVAGR